MKVNNGTKFEHKEESQCDSFFIRCVKIIVSSVPSLTIYFIILFSVYLLEDHLSGIHSFLQNQWNKVLRHYDYDQQDVMVKGIVISGSIFFWSMAFIYTFIDFTGKPEFMKKYKIQSGQNEPLELTKFLKALFVAILNLIFISSPFLLIFYMVMKYRGYDESPIIPKLHSILWQVSFCIFIQDVFFYYSHRALHHKSIYRYIHKYHHDWQAPIAIAAVYAHPIEHIISGLVSAFAGPLTLGSHPFTIILWNLILMHFILTDHCGYHLPFNRSNERHDFHHFKFTECFGTSGLLDYLHGTDAKFMATKNYSRDKIVFSFIPQRQAVPDS